MVFALTLCQTKLMSSSNSHLESIYWCEEMISAVDVVMVEQLQKRRNLIVHLNSIGFTGW